MVLTVITHMHLHPMFLVSSRHPLAHAAMEICVMRVRCAVYVWGSSIVSSPATGTAAVPAGPLAFPIGHTATPSEVAVRARPP